MQHLLDDNQNLDVVAINHEIHARPFLKLEPNFNCTHLVYLSDFEHFDDEFEHMQNLCDEMNVIPPQKKTKQTDLIFGDMIMRFERHHEFTTYTFITPNENKKPFETGARANISEVWFDQIIGTPLHKMRIFSEVKSQDEFNKTDYLSYLETDRIFGGLIADGKATLLSDLSYDEEGYMRYIISDHGHSEDRLGRTLQYLLELETYRMMTLLTVPIIARETPIIEERENQLRKLSHQLTEAHTGESDKALMDQILALSEKVEKSAFDLNYRIAASRAYQKIMWERIEILRENRIPKTQRFTSYYRRRMIPTMRRFDAIKGRLEALSKQISNNAAMLRTRVDLTLEEQNQALLKSMDRRADLQLKLQETVEGLSVVAISYYLIGIAGYFIKAIAKIYPVIDATITTCIIAPFLIAFVYFSTKAIKKKFH